MHNETRPFGSLLEYPLRSGVTIAKDSRGTGIRMVNMRELFKYPRLGDVEMELVHIDVSNRDRFLLRDGDLLFARRSLTAEGAGRCSIVTSCRQDTTWESSIIRARVDPKFGVPDYFYYYFSSPSGRRQMESIIEQVAAAGIRSSDLARLQVPYPAPCAQKAIAEVLKSLDDKISVNVRLARSCHALAQAISVHAHSGSQFRSLSDLAIITMGSSPPGETYNEDCVGIPFYQGTRDFGERFPSRRVWCTSPARIAPRLSTMVSVRAPVGELNVAREPCCIGRGVASAQSRYGTPSVLFHELAGSPDAWRPYESEGTVFGSINRDQMESLQIRSLDQSAAQKLEGVIGPLDQKVEAAFVENQTLSELRDALLPRLMSGEVSVRDAEKTAEDAT